jgi:HD-GYP domain-containing protein (c-di-GMP phosphodiesterase class II)
VATAPGAVRIDVRQLCPGLYISLGERWFDHNFLFNSFRLVREDQIARVRATGLTHVDYWPHRSTALPLPLPVDARPSSPAASPAAPSSTPPVVVDAPAQVTAAQAELAERQRRATRNAERRAALARCEKAYLRSAGAVKELMSRVFVAPAEAAEQAETLVDTIVVDLLADQHAVLNLMSEGTGEPAARYHALNVMILSLMLGRAAGLRADALKRVALGALLHDLGKVQVQAQVLRIDPASRNRHEEAAYRQHVEYGTVLCQQLGMAGHEVLHIVRHHHERLDGRGFPDGLSGAAIPVATRIVAIANRFDGLCHAIDPRNALTPSAALVQMYRNESSAWDPVLLQRFVKCLGVWPPGTIVQLSNGAIGLVTSVQPDATLRPVVQVADLSVPRAEALIVDLREAPDVKVERALQAADVEPEILSYLSPRTRLNWFVGSDIPQ